MNDPQYCTGQLMAFVRQVVDQQGKVPKYEYNNLVVELFAEKLSGKTEEEVLKICQAIYIIGISKHIILENVTMNTAAFGGRTEKQIMNTTALIMAGGRGERFWPRSPQKSAQAVSVPDG